jgi:hypothetical protein
MEIKMFETQFCKVEYLQDMDAVLCSWKKYCNFDDYREPLTYGLKLINENNATTWITDTTNGFESTPEDNQWLATEFSPKAINSSCKTIVFIITNDSPLKNEIEVHSQLLKQFFEVKSVEQLADVSKC